MHHSSWLLFVLLVYCVPEANLGSVEAVDGVVRGKGADELAHVPSSKTWGFSADTPSNWDGSGKHCIDFNSSTLVYDNTFWEVPQQLCLVPIQNATVLTGGLLYNGSGAFTFHHWYWVKELRMSKVSSSSLQSKSFVDKSFVSFIQIWQNRFQHIAFDTYPKSKILCSLLTQKTDMGILVTGELQRDLIIESCTSLEKERFIFVEKETFSASSIAASIWKPNAEYKMGLIPPSSIASLGSQTSRGDKVLYLARASGTKRSVANQEEVLRVIKKHVGDKIVVVHPENSWRVDRPIFEQASMIIGPHGGAMANMIFAPANTTVIEFLPLTRLKKRGANERPCYFGLARGMGFAYHAVEPPDFTFERPMTVPLLELENTLSLAYHKPPSDPG